MTCQNRISSSCSENSAYIDCIQSIYQNIGANITITLLGSDGLPLDLDNIFSIEIILYDVRLNILVSRFIYPDNTTITGESLIGIEPKCPTSKLIVDGAPINILQSTISTIENLFLNKGEISINIDQFMSKYLMAGAAIVDIKFVDKNGNISLIQKFTVGLIKINKFSTVK